MSLEQIDQSLELPEESLLINHFEDDALAPETLLNVSVSLDPVKDYLRGIGQYPLLKAEQEVDLSIRIEAGLVARHKLEGPLRGSNLEQRKEELSWLAEDGERAKDELYNSNLRLVVSIAKKFVRPGGMPFLDLIQEGNIGLMRGVEKFDYTKGYKFSTYATWWIRQQITRGIANQTLIVRLPVHVHEELNQVISTRRTMERQLAREPKPEEIARELGMKFDRVIDLMSWGRGHVSLDTPIDDAGDTSLGDLLGQETAVDPADAVLDQDLKDQMEDMLDLLEERKADIIRSRNGLGGRHIHKLGEIGLRLNLSAERIRQLEREAMKELEDYAQKGIMPNKEQQKDVLTTVEEFIPRHHRYSAIPLISRTAIRQLVSRPDFVPEQTGMTEKQWSAFEAYNRKGTKKAVLDIGVKPSEVDALVSNAVARLVEHITRPLPGY